MTDFEYKAFLGFSAEGQLPANHGV